MTLNDILTSATEAEGKGVPVNWKELAMQVYTAASQHIAAQEEKITNLEAQLSEPELPLDDIAED